MDEVEQPTVNPELPPQHVKKGVSSITILIFLIFGFSLLLLLGVALYRFLRNAHNDQEYDRKMAIQKQRDYQIEIQDISVSVHPDMSDRSSINAIESDKKMRQSLGLYENQYDPTNAFSIFVPSQKSDSKRRNSVHSGDSMSHLGSDMPLTKDRGSHGSRGSSRGSPPNSA